MATDPVDDRPDPGLKCLGNRIAECSATVGRNHTKVSDSSFGILDLHTRRNVRNAASTSSSVATPLCSASSIARNSSRVAR